MKLDARNDPKRNNKLLLLRKETNVHETEKDISPLYIACQRGNTDIVQLLLEHGANVNMLNNGIYWYPVLLGACLSSETRGKNKIFRLL